MSFASARGYTNQMNLQERIGTAVSQQSLESGKLTQTQKLEQVRPVLTGS